MKLELGIVAVSLLILNFVFGMRAMELHKRFVDAKIHNDASIAKDTKRVADTMEAVWLKGLEGSCSALVYSRGSVVSSRVQKENPPAATSCGSPLSSHKDI